MFCQVVVMICYWRTTRVGHRHLPHGFQVRRHVDRQLAIGFLKCQAPSCIVLFVLAGNSPVLARSDSLKK
jgi:hypothetical protein